MKLHDQVCTIEQAKRLKELGVKQDSILSWYNATDRDDTPGLNNSRQYDCPTCGHPDAPYFEELSAFMVAELGVMLPDDTRSYQYDHCWQIYYPDEGVMSLFLSEDCDTEAQIRGAFLIWRLETGKITADEVNKRLTAE